MFDDQYSLEGPAPGFTGRYLILLEKDAIDAGATALSSALEVEVDSAADFDQGAVEGDQLREAEAVVFDKIAVAVVDIPPEKSQDFRTAAAEEDAILAVEPERVVYALQGDLPGEVGLPTPTTSAELTSTHTLPVEFLLGYRSAVDHLVSNLLNTSGLPDGGVGQPAVAPLADTTDTWGLQATGVSGSQFSGEGIKVAVLDTGFDLGHPDFTGRSITAKSFVANQEVQDGHGHGTHCIGTACGPRRPGELPRYGTAYNAEIFAGKVLNNQGSGTDEGILAGINWAITSGCQVVSMSLGAAVSAGGGFSKIFEQVAKQALDQGTVIVAAAGNESNRPFSIKPVGHPANCPSIMAVAALTPQSRVASFSCGSINQPGGGIDVAAPGVEVRSSWPRPTLYRTLQGTSMATPHVAGIAALHAEANPGISGRALSQAVFETARRLNLPSTDVGVGLVQAP